jgi:cell division protein FtsB
MRSDARMQVQRRNRRSRGGAAPARLFWWGGLGLFCAYLLFFLVFGRMGLVAHLRLKDEAGRIEGEISKVEGEIDVLAHKVDALNRDPHTIERLARERLGMVRPGETVYLFDRPPGDEAPAGPETSPPPGP